MRLKEEVRGYSKRKTMRRTGGAKPGKGGKPLRSSNVERLAGRPGDWNVGGSLRPGGEYIDLPPFESGCGWV